MKTFFNNDHRPSLTFVVRSHKAQSVIKVKSLTEQAESGIRVGRRVERSSQIARDCGRAAVSYLAAQERRSRDTGQC